MKSKLSISAKVSNGVIQVQIDGKKVPLDNDQRTIDLACEEDHVLNWFVRAPSGTNYTVSITEPKSVEFDHKATIDSSGKDAGTYWFKI